MIKFVTLIDLVFKNSHDRARRVDILFRKAACKNGKPKNKRFSSEKKKIDNIFGNCVTW